MRKTAKKFISLVAVATLFGSMLAMTACGGDFYKGKTLDGYTASATATEAGKSNGGFAVEKGDYIYYINGSENYSATNSYGDVVKGALMRIKKSDLTAGNYENADVVVPMMFVSQDYDSGIFIYGDYVYYATPTSDKNMQGQVTNSWIDFKRAKLDGSETMKGYYFRLSNNATKFRFVAEGESVYCLYEEDGMLKSFNTSTGVTTVLVKGGTYFYDMKDLTNGNVYYTMGVTYNADTDTSTTATYNQVYCVNAAATATVDAKNASYTAGGRTYDFDETWMKAQNDKAKETAEANGTEYTATYDFDDYSTYPYVNLGTLVLDGVGKNQEGTTVFNNTHDVKERTELKGYTYTLARYENGGIYYTKASEQADAQLYYLATANGATNAVTANAKAERVAWNTTNASSTALFEVSEKDSVRTHTVLYIADAKVNKVTTVNGVVSEPVVICDAASDAVLWKTEKEGEDGVLYYYAAGSNPVTGTATSGYSLSKVVYTGDKKVYENLGGLNADAKYKSVTMNYVDFNSGWYKPEMFDGVLMYANAEAIGSSSYNYIYATKLALSDIEANNKAYEAAYELMDDKTEKDTIKKAMTYYYREGEKALAVVKELYEAKLYSQTDYEVFEEYVKEQTACSMIALIGKADDVISADDKEMMEEDWRSTLPSETENTEDESGLETWAICLIIAGAVVVVAAAIIVPVIILSKKKAEREAREAITNAYKRPKIDTTDDKSIDVYADDEVTEEAPAEAVEEPAQEVVEPVEEVAEETVEAVEVPATEETTQE